MVNHLFESVLSFLFLVMVFLLGSLFISYWIERDILKAVVVSDTPEGCYEYTKQGKIWVECPEVTRRVGRGTKLDYYSTMKRSGYLEMKTWYMEKK